MKDTIFEMRNNLLSKIENLSASSEEIGSLKKDFEAFSKDTSAQIRILNRQIENNEKSLANLARGHRELRTYVVAAVEIKATKSKFSSIRIPKLRQMFRSAVSFSESHGGIIAYTLLLSGLASTVTYFVLTRFL